MRSEGNDAVVDCDDPVIALACNLDSEDCPAACKSDSKDNDSDKEVVKSGDLEVEIAANKGASVISNGATSELDTLTFKTSEDITLKSVTLERYGLSTANSVASIWLEDEDGNKVTAEKSLSTSKDTVTLSIKKDYQSIKDGSSLVVVITTPNTGAADLGKSIGFKVTDVDSSAKNVDLSNSTNLYDIIDYKGTDAKVQFKGSDKVYSYENGESYEIAKLKITASNAALVVDGFTLTQANGATMDLDEFIDEVEVLADGEKVKSSFSVKKDELRLSIDSHEIAINKSATFTVKVTLKDFDEFGNTVKLGLEDSSDVNVSELKNKVRVSIYDYSDASGNHFTTTGVWGPKYTFNGGKINLENVKLNTTIDAAEGSDDVVIAKGNITLAGQAIRIKTLKLEPSNETYVDSVKLVVDDEEFEATKNNSWTVKSIVIDEDSEVKVTVDIKDNLNLGTNAPTFTIKVNGKNTANLSKSTLSGTVIYDDTSSQIAGQAQDNLVGSISISTVKIQPAKGSLTNDKTKKVEFKVNQTKSETVFEGTYSAKDNGNVSLDNVRIVSTNLDASLFTGVAAGETDDSNISFTVYVDNEKVATLDNPKKASATYSGEEADFSAVTVEAGKSVAIKVVANVYADHPTVNNIEYRMYLAGKDDNGNDAGNANRLLAPLSFVDNSSINVSTNESMKQQDVVLANKSQNLATFIVKPANKASTAELDNLEFTLSGFNTLLSTVNNSTLDAEDLFEVLVGGKKVDNISFSGGKTKLLVTDMKKDIEGETKVEVNFLEKLETGTKGSSTIGSGVWVDGSCNTGSSITSGTACTALSGGVWTPGTCDADTSYTPTGDNTTDKTACEALNKTTTNPGNAAIYGITLNNVNGGDDLGDAFAYRRTAVNSLVKVVSMKGDKESQTKYVFDIQYSDDANNEKIDSLKFTYNPTVAGYNGWRNVQADKTYSVDNQKDVVKYVTEITWTDGDGYTVTLDYDTDTDFFEVGSNDDRLRAYKDD